jgi:hypothetical protein
MPNEKVMFMAEKEIKILEFDAILVSEYNEKLSLVLQRLREGWQLDRRFVPNPVVIANSCAIYHLFHEIKKDVKSKGVNVV